MRYYRRLDEQLAVLAAKIKRDPLPPNRTALIKLKITARAREDKGKKDAVRIMGIILQQKHWY